MRFDYGTQISPTPITLSIGTLRKPKLKEICELTFDKFTFYEFLAKMTPEIYYTQLNEKNGGKEYWESFTEEQQNDITLYSLILEDDFLSNIYVGMLNFFFVVKWQHDIVWCMRRVESMRLQCFFRPYIKATLLLQTEDMHIITI